MKPARRFFIETWGCQMNELDSQRMTGQLMQQGILPTRQPEEADILLLNSCSVRENAQNKVYSRIGEYRRFKANRPDLLIGLCGCVAQQEGERALKKVADLDFVLGTARVADLADVVRRCRLGERVVATGFPEDRSFDLDTISRDGSYKGMVTVIEGCDQRCTFCIVPLTRGPERCRPIGEILREVRHLVSYGFREIELLGQTVNHWRQPASAGPENGGGGEEDFADLLEAVATIPGVERLRFLTSYPRDFTSRMVAQLGKHENICPYLHLPVQSGSNAVLRRMGRRYTVESYYELVDELRAARPDLVLSTDLIVGFPGETDEDYEATLALVRRIRYGSIYAFKYSPRPGTAAPRLNDAVAPEVAAQRLNRLFEIQAEIQSELNRSLVGERFDVIVTGWGKQPGFLVGRSPCHRVVNFAAGSQAPALGEITRVEIETAYPHSLIGKRIGSTEPVATPALPVVSG